jgi:hypothetical protein
MITVARVALVTLAALTLVPASAGTSGARPRVALTASPSHVALAGAARATVRVTNSGASRVVVDVSRAGFALDLRGRPKIVGRPRSARSAAGWLTFHPRAVALRVGGSASVTIASKLPPRAEPGDHDALLLFTTRRHARDGVAVRMRMGIVVVVRAPGTVVRRLELRRLRVLRSGHVRVLELAVVNRGNVTESFSRAHATVSLERGGRRIAKLGADSRELRPQTNGILQFRYRGEVRGSVIAHVDVTPDSSGRVVTRTFRLRL